MQQESSPENVPAAIRYVTLRPRVIPLAIVAASPLLRAGLEAYVRADPVYEVIARTPNWSDASVMEAEVALVVSGDDSAEMIAWAGTPSAPRVVVLTATPRLGLFRAENVRGVLPVEADATEILAALTAVRSGLLVMTAETAGLRDGVGAWSGTAPAPLENGLTGRETQVLRMLAEGVSNKEVGYRLGISEHTVKFHVNAIMGKLGAGSRTEAVVLGVRRGLVPL